MDEENAGLYLADPHLHIAAQLMVPLMRPDMDEAGVERATRLASYAAAELLRELGYEPPAGATARL